jgi:glycosyltransferase involved in cell wall biosynthesis
MMANIITTIPVYNGAEFLLQTLESVAAQTVKPDRVIVLDDCSTDQTAQIVKSFSAIQCELIRNPKNLGLFGNCNRALEFAEQARYLNILHQDDTLDPKFYETLTGALDDCPGRGMAYCLDERIDENNRRLSLSGRVTGEIEVESKDNFLRGKAEIGNQAFSGTLLRTNQQPAPIRFRLDMAILGDIVFWGEWGAQCEKIVKVHSPLVRYRWHGANSTTSFAPSIQSLILDEWKAMELVEALRNGRPDPVRRLKLKGLMAVRSGIKAKRTRQNGNADYSARIVQAARSITGWPLWLAGQVLVETRDFLIYTIGGRPRHPKNIYS